MHVLRLSPQSACLPSLYLNQMIKRPPVRLPAGYIQLPERTPELRYLIDSQFITCLRLQITQDLHGGQPLAFLFFRHRTKITMEQLFQRAYLLKFTVRLFQNLLVILVQPVTLSFIDGFHRLRVKLFVINSDVRADRSRHFDTDKTAAAAGVGQQIFLIARADKRSVTTHFADSVAVRFTQVGNRFLQQMFQKSLLADIYLVELINVYQEKTSQITLRLLLAFEVDAVRIAETQFRRQDDTAKR